MMGPVRLFAALLPLAGLAGLWGWSDYQNRQGTEWDVPIMGYDPRDYLRGHYVEFTYDWPGIDGAGVLERLCLAGNAPVIARVTRMETTAALDDCAHPVRASTSGVYGIGSLRRGRLYLGQDRARVVDEQLRNRDQRGIIRIRQRDDGTITPVDIRFLPLTAKQRAERDRDITTPAAVPIMIEPQSSTDD